MNKMSIQTIYVTNTNTNYDQIKAPTLNKPNTKRIHLNVYTKMPKVKVNSIA